MSEEVCLAAMMPARRAVCSGSPLATPPLRMTLSAAALIVIAPAATASRAVTGFAPTSTIFTRPRASTCDSFGERLLATVLPLRQIERQALERDRQIHALEFHICRHFERAGREVQHRF